MTVDDEPAASGCYRAARSYRDDFTRSAIIAAPGLRVHNDAASDRGLHVVISGQRLAAFLAATSNTDSRHRLEAAVPEVAEHALAVRSDHVLDWRLYDAPYLMTGGDQGDGFVGVCVGNGVGRDSMRVRRRNTVTQTAIVEQALSRSFCRAPRPVWIRDEWTSSTELHLVSLGEGDVLRDRRTLLGYAAAFVACLDYAGMEVAAGEN